MFNDGSAKEAAAGTRAWRVFPSGSAEAAAGTSAAADGSAEAAAGTSAAAAEVEAVPACGSDGTAAIVFPAAPPKGVSPELAVLGAASPVHACVGRGGLGDGAAGSGAGPMNPHRVKSSTVSAPYAPWQKALKPICACGIVENSRAAFASNASNLSAVPREPPMRNTMTSRARPPVGTRPEPTSEQTAEEELEPTTAAE